MIIPTSAEGYYSGPSIIRHHLCHENLLDKGGCWINKSDLLLQCT